MNKKRMIAEIRRRFVNAREQEKLARVTGADSDSFFEDWVTFYQGYGDALGEFLEFVEGTDDQEKDDRRDQEEV